MKVPAIWWEGDFAPESVSVGWLVHHNDDGEYVVDRGAGRETLTQMGYLVLVAECPTCKQWSMHVNVGGGHDLGCIVGGDRYPWEDPYEGFSDMDDEDDEDDLPQ